MSLYETDFVKWAEEQAALLTERRFDLLDLDNLIEEVDDLAGRHRDALQSQLKVLLIHLLKLTYSTGSREPETAWKRSIRNARDQIDDLVADYPSLRTRLAELCERAYPRAARDAHNELRDYGDDHERFPESCPWTLAELLDHEFWPR
ncbi:MAG: hypothetical protein ETSY1_38830 [Candidatus Entotheonella factor]|uniref:DUF29 domain-containing protein n=1 Tax=Entotheonella factor TaxID=1429438 RepID=W4L766_ENTF1|nr:DUF29 domain-containing protein [Candidatus Entotheonella palauensis]ETW93525.1 MAG: hypothetical protein ETSY1_38830 [Candidatus Entotheonella factor]